MKLSQKFRVVAANMQVLFVEFNGKLIHKTHAYLFLGILRFLFANFLKKQEDTFCILLYCSIVEKQRPARQKYEKQPALGLQKHSWMIDLVRVKVGGPTRDKPWNIFMVIILGLIYPRIIPRKH